jgi:thiamine-monophosphate kinase
MSGRSRPPVSGDNNLSEDVGRGREFDLIERIRARTATRPDVILGIGDDAALLQVPDGHELVVSTDTLIAGVHFPEDTSAPDIGWKALAVNLSDLAAMGATPAWASLALTMPAADEEWLDGFLDGFCELADEHEVALVGGDTTRGPLSITITVHGLVPAGTALRRDGAGFNDDVWVTGTLGDAGGALQQWKGKGLMSAKLRHRLDRPTPRITAGIALRGLASAAIDISDGLVADLGHLLRRSGTGAELDLARLPTSRTLADHFTTEADRWRLQLGSGDDYELCFTAAAANALAIEQAMAAIDTPATVIGRITREPVLQLRKPDGEAFAFAAGGYQHFSGSDK